MKEPKLKKLENWLETDDFQEILDYVEGAEDLLDIIVFPRHFVERLETFLPYTPADLEYDYMPTIHLLRLLVWLKVRGDQGFFTCSKSESLSFFIDVVFNHMRPTSGMFPKGVKDAIWAWDCAGQYGAKNWSSWRTLQNDNDWIKDYIKWQLKTS